MMGLLENYIFGSSCKLPYECPKNRNGCTECKQLMIEAHDADVRLAFLNEILPIILESVTDTLDKFEPGTPPGVRTDFRNLVADIFKQKYSKMFSKED